MADSTQTMAVIVFPRSTLEDAIAASDLYPYPLAQPIDGYDIIEREGGDLALAVGVYTDERDILLLAAEVEPGVYGLVQARGVLADDASIC